MIDLFGVKERGSGALDCNAHSQCESQSSHPNKTHSVPVSKVSIAIQHGHASAGPHGIEGNIT